MCSRFHYVKVYICAILLRLQLMDALAGDTKIKIDCVYVLNYVRTGSIWIGNALAHVINLLLSDVGVPSIPFHSTIYGTMSCWSYEKRLAATATTGELSRARPRD